MAFLLIANSQRQPRDLSTPPSLLLRVTLKMTTPCLMIKASFLTLPLIARAELRMTTAFHARPGAPKLPRESRHKGQLAHCECVQAPKAAALGVRLCIVCRDVMGATRRDDVEHLS